MARPTGPKTRCSGKWSEAKFKSFIKSLLRHGTRRWAPIQECDRKATTKRGFRLCAGCDEEVPVTVVEGRKRVKNTFVDHKEPIVDPEQGFTTWDECIERMFCEADNLQVLCKTCHDIKSAEERSVAAQRRKREKELND